VSPLRRRLIAGGSVLSLVAGIAVTLALWNAGATTAGPIITVGRLAATTGDFRWLETSPDVPKDKRLSGSGAASLAVFHAMPGDSLELRQAFKIDASGRNLHFEVDVAWTAPDQAALAPLTATYVLLDAVGTVVAGGAGTPVGTPVSVEGLAAGDHTLTVVVTLQYAASDSPVYATASDAARRTLEVPALEVSARQVREAAP
jgi:alternate signal-mediated exported protein